MFEEDHIYISAALFSIDWCMPNWPRQSVVGLGYRYRQTVLELSCPGLAMQAAIGTAFSTPWHSGWEESIQADIIGLGDTGREGLMLW